MPQSKSKKQYRMMQAIIHSKKPYHGGDRTPPPKYIAEKYTAPGKGAPESKDKNTGGDWGKDYEKRRKEKAKDKRIERKKKKASLRKSFEMVSQVISSKGVGALVVDSSGRILIGVRSDDKKWSLPGGFVEKNETCSDASIRELLEETGIFGTFPEFIDGSEGQHNGNKTECFLFTTFTGIPKDTDELNQVHFCDYKDLPFDNMRDECIHSINCYFKNKNLSKSNKISDMLLSEQLEKAINRTSMDRGEAVYEVSHGDALSLIHTGIFRSIFSEVKGMKSGDSREIKLNNCILYIRKHDEDIYSGRMEENNKIIHEFRNKSIPSLTADIMSVLELYGDEEVFASRIYDEDEISNRDLNNSIEGISNRHIRDRVTHITQEMTAIQQLLREKKISVDKAEIEIKAYIDELEEYLICPKELDVDFKSEEGDDLERLKDSLVHLSKEVNVIFNSQTVVSSESKEQKKISSLENAINSIAIHCSKEAYINKEISERIIKLEESIRGLMTSPSGSEEINQKLIQLEAKLESISNKPTKVDAFSANPKNPSIVYDQEYSYLTKPEIIIEPNGKIRIIFNPDWNHFDKENFLKDIKAKIINKKVE